MNRNIRKTAIYGVKNNNIEPHPTTSNNIEQLEQFEQFEQH
jgi:hypothetical protein